MGARRVGFDEVDALREHLLLGGVVAIPTESSYGLAVDPRNAAAVRSIFVLKGRARGEPLPVVVADPAQAAGLGVDVEAPVVRWARRHWPAPLTVLAPFATGAVPVPAAAGSRLLAIRVPSHERLRRFLGALGFGLTATSANRSGAPPMTRPGELAEWLPDEALLLEDGELPGGPPSTVVGFSAEEPSHGERRDLGTLEDDEAHLVVHRAGRFPL